MSDKQFHDANIESVKNILKNNCFFTLLQFINRYINKRLKCLKNKTVTVDVNVRNAKIFDARKYITIPFIGDLSENIRRSLNICDLEMQYTILQNRNKLDHLIRKGKDKLNQNKKTELVY